MLKFGRTILFQSSPAIVFLSNANLCLKVVEQLWVVGVYEMSKTWHLLKNEYHETVVFKFVRNSFKTMFPSFFISYSDANQEKL